MKIGIVCDNYKLDKFKVRLSKMGIEFKMGAFTKDTTAITMTVPADKLTEVKKLCEQVEREKLSFN